MGLIVVQNGMPGKQEGQEDLLYAVLRSILSESRTHPGSDDKYVSWWYVPDHCRSMDLDFIDVHVWDASSKPGILIPQISSKTLHSQPPKRTPHLKPLNDTTNQPTCHYMSSGTLKHQLSENTKKIDLAPTKNFIQNITQPTKSQGYHLKDTTQPYTTHLGVAVHLTRYPLWSNTSRWHSSNVHRSTEALPVIAAGAAKVATLHEGRADPSVPLSAMTKLHQIVADDQT